MSDTLNEIMVVDDDIDTLNVLSEILLSENYIVRAMNDPVLALQSAFTDPPDLILLDVVMPGINGYEVCRNLKDSPRTKDIPVLFVSVLLEVKEQLKGFQEGGLDFITKPIQSDIVLARVATHLKLYKLQQKLSELISVRTEELKRSENKYEHLIKALQNNHFFYTLDLSGRFVYFSSSVESILGYSQSDLLENYRNYFTPSSLEKLAKYTVLNNDALEDYQEYELSITGKNGKQYYLEMKNFPVFDENNVLIQFDGIAQNITARKSAEIKYKKIQKLIVNSEKLGAVGRLAGGVSHYLNNMLGVILGYAELIQVKSEADDDVKQKIEHIIEAGEKSKDIIQQLMAFSQVLPANPRVININNAIDNVCNMLYAVIGGRVRLIFEPSNDLWETKIDLSQLNQLLINLCINAKDAMNGQGDITIKTENSVVNNDEITAEGVTSGEYVQLSVNDTGSGIAQNDIENIFEPFYTTKSMYVNNGLGLSAVYGIVKQNNGFILIDTDDKSTTFKIYLPRCGIL